MKSKSFALRCMKLYRFLGENKEFVIAKQLLRSGTSIGANIREALEGASKADFGYKMNIALKETSESGYWLEILHNMAFWTKNNSLASMRIARNCTRC